METANASQDSRRIEAALRKAAAECYSIEGFYPESLEYLKRHYGLYVDEERYEIMYQPQGENLLPQMYVYRKGEIK